MSQHADFLEFKELSLRLRELTMGKGGGLPRGCCRPLCKRCKDGRGGGGSGDRAGGGNGGAQGGEDGEYVPWWWFNDTEDTGGGGDGGQDDGDGTDAVAAMVNPIHLSRDQKAAEARGEETKGEGRRVVNPLYARMSSSSTRGGSLRSLGSFGSLSSSNASFTHANALSRGDSTGLVDELTSSANVATDATGDAAVGVRAAAAEERHAELVEAVDPSLDGTGGTDGASESGEKDALANNPTSSVDGNRIKEKGEEEGEEDKQPDPWTHPSIDPVVDTEAAAEAKAAVPQTREVGVATAATHVALMSTRTQSVDIDILDEEEGGYGDFTSDVTPNSLYTEHNNRSVSGEVGEGAFVGGAHSGGDGGEYTYNTESGGHGGYDERGGSYDENGQFTEHGGYDEHGGYYDEHGQYVGHNEHGEYGGHEGRWGHEMTTPIVDAAEANAAPEKKLGNDYVVDLVEENVTDNTPSNTIANDTIGDVQDDTVGNSGYGGYGGGGGGSGSILRTAAAAANAAITAVPPSKSDDAAAAASHGRQRAAPLSLQSARARLRRIIGEGAESATLGGDDADDESARLRLAQ